MKSAKAGASGGPEQRAALWLMLLVALAFGVLGMHTVGHHPSLRGSGVESAMADLRHTPVVPAGEQSLSGSDGHGRGVDAFAVCLAVLGAAVVLASLSMLRRCRRELPVSARARQWTWGRGCGPPPRPPLGLRMTAVSVLRT
ncbi:hypothetical protein AB0N38_28650 [Micromonospora aurantiaca]|uniref:Uncharacterized protein n=1 Tax=Micromonospora aurantiaca (nom. illeg.) TaxID=47850 RepID=A0A3M9KB19_9ACTN|nr:MULTISPECIES: hypothetical protein [Micromonospora]AXH93630.1 hypothetical protein DVH21_28995 [Micromonospora aurantiaca]KAB1118673.1 hypothetical protein F6X54_02840 [Micromonospora aurantiaca]MBC8992553.1 hypothetical protein [Micromonospora chalcea]MCT2280409.1 hypothetical protein [Micromonospora chalcea]MDG4752766.1 hypothetical protein [Micromonospora sp. WMMD718]